VCTYISHAAAERANFDESRERKSYIHINLYHHHRARGKVPEPFSLCSARLMNSFRRVARVKLHKCVGVCVCVCVLPGRENSSFCLNKTEKRAEMLCVT